MNIILFISNNKTFAIMALIINKKIVQQNNIYHQDGFAMKDNFRVHFSFFFFFRKRGKLRAVAKNVPCPPLPVVGLEIKNNKNNKIYI